MAIKINRVYTRGGDEGQTSLAGGERVAKDHPRVEAYGEVDELNSAIGVVRALLAEAPYKGRAAATGVDGSLAKVQQGLFDIGAELASGGGGDKRGVGASEVEELEAAIDAITEELEPLSSFVLPSGDTATAALHLARAVCRRAERRVVALMDLEEVRPWPLTYLNRLSDLLFVQARWLTKESGQKEILWQHGLEPRHTAKSKTDERKASGKK